jgi:hypothetical protein
MPAKAESIFDLKYAIRQFFVSLKQKKRKKCAWKKVKAFKSASASQKMQRQKITVDWSLFYSLRKKLQKICAPPNPDWRFFNDFSTK